MIEKDLTVINKLGLHARAAAKVVSVASRYRCAIHVHTHGPTRVHSRARDAAPRPINAKSIMGLLTLGAAKGTVLRVRVEGDDEQPAMTELADLFARRFDEAE